MNSGATSSLPTVVVTPDDDYRALANASHVLLGDVERRNVDLVEDLVEDRVEDERCIYIAMGGDMVGYGGEALVIVLQVASAPAIVEKVLEDESLSADADAAIATPSIFLQANEDDGPLHVTSDATTVESPQPSSCVVLHLNGATSVQTPVHHLLQQCLHCRGNRFVVWGGPDVLAVLTHQLELDVPPDIRFLDMQLHFKHPSTSTTNGNGRRRGGAALQKRRPSLGYVLKRIAWCRSTANGGTPPACSGRPSSSIPWNERHSVNQRGVHTDDPVHVDLALAWLDQLQCVSSVDALSTLSMNDVDATRLVVLPTSTTVDACTRGLREVITDPLGLRWIYLQKYELRHTCDQVRAKAIRVRIGRHMVELNWHSKNRPDGPIAQAMLRLSPSDANMLDLTKRSTTTDLYDLDLRYDPRRGVCAFASTPGDATHHTQVREGSEEMLVTN